MPKKTIHCSLCGKSISGTSFPERMKKLRRHRKKHHPTAHKRSVKKSQATRQRNIRQSPARKAWNTRRKRYGKTGRK